MKRSASQLADEASEMLEMSEAASYLEKNLNDLYSNINSKNIDKQTSAMKDLTTQTMKLIGANNDFIAGNKKAQ
ncbi:MAG: hypothetical protein ACI4VL_05530 [Bacilli bacterium]